MAGDYPLMLDVSLRPIVIVGGGNVAVRKARGLIDAGAKRITVVSPTIHLNMPASTHRIEENFAPRHLDGAQLVFAATNLREVNDQVVREGHKRGLLVCRADTSQELAGDFSTPAVYRDGGLSISVSAGGNPAVAAALRDALATHVQPHWPQWIETASALRSQIIADQPADRRAGLLRALASADASAAVARGGAAELSAWFRQHCAENLK